MVNRFYILTAILLVKNTALCVESTPECPVKVNENQLFQAYCANRGLLQVPSHIPAYIQVLDLSNNSDLHFTPNAFRRYGHALVHLKLSHIRNVPQQRARHLAPLDVFLPLYKLEIFEFTHSNLTDDEMWRFPASLRKLVLDGNLYTYVDVSTSHKLQQISVNDNRLKNLPTLYESPVHVVKCSLKNNPLDDFAVDRLAPLCNLNTLELEIPQGAFLTRTIGNCRCRQLMKWIELFNISGANLACTNLTDSECDFNFDHYMKIRAECPAIENPSTTIHRPKITRTLTAQQLFQESYVNILIGIISVCLLVFVIFKITQRFRRPTFRSRKTSRRSKNKKSKPVYVEDEEEEDDEIGHRF